MAKAARAFDVHGHSKLFATVPKSPTPAREVTAPSWQAANHGAMPEMMFELRFADGQVLCYPFHHLHGIRYRDAGYMELNLLGREVIKIMGRHLRELMSLFRTGRLQWVEEIDDRDDTRPNEQPTVVKIEIEPVEE